MTKILLRNLPQVEGGGLYHFTDDDSRQAVDKDFKCFCIFTSDLNVLDVDKKQIGTLSSAGPTWKFLREGKEDFDTQIPIMDYHWVKIELAEIAVAEFLYKEMQKSQTNESTDDFVEDESVDGIEED